MAQVKSLQTGIKFKDTPIGKIPVDWEVSQLSQVAEIIMGQSPSSQVCHDYEEGLPFYQGNADFGPKYPTTRRWCEKPLKIAQKDDILISVRAPVGEINIAPHECCIGRGLSAIRATKINDKYLYQSMLFHRTALEKVSQGSTFEAINRKDLSEFLMFIPPLPEQKKIAEILTTVDDAIEETDRIIEKTREMKAGLLQKFILYGIDENGDIRSKKTHKFKDSPIGRIPVEWESPCLDEICSIVTNGYVGPTRDLYRKSGIPYLVSKNIRPNEIIKEPFAFVDEKFQQANKRSILREGDVLTVQTGAIGDTCVIPKEFEGANCHALIISRPIPERLNSFWLSEYFNSPIGKKEFSRIATGLAHPHLNSTFVRRLNIPVPPKNEQDKIVRILLTLNDEISNEKDHQQNLESLKKPLMQVLLTGKVRVKLH